MTAWRHFNPKPVKAWDVEALAHGTPDAASEARGRRDIGNLLNALEAAGAPKSKWASQDCGVGDFAMLDGRWCRISAVVATGWRSRRPRYELQDVACPDMPRHSVAWSLIERVARVTREAPEAAHRRRPQSSA